MSGLRAAVLAWLDTVSNASRMMDGLWSFPAEPSRRQTYGQGGKRGEEGRWHSSPTLTLNKQRDILVC